MPDNAGDQAQYLGWEDPLKKERATHSSILAWEILWTEEPGSLQSLGVTKSQIGLNDRAHMQHSIVYIHPIF